MVAPTTVSVRDLNGIPQDYHVPGDAELGYPEGSLDGHREGATEPWTVDIIVALAKAIRAQNILETGTFKGLTTMALWENLDRNGVIHTVEADLERAMAAANELDQLGIQVYNQEALTFIEEWSGDPFDFVFLDDSHYPPHLAAELDALYNPTRPEEAKVTRGAIICVHDVIGPCGLDAVVKARHGYVLDLPLLHIGGGLGIIQVPPLLPPGP